MTLATPIYSPSNSPSVRHKRVSRSRPSPRSSPMPAPMPSTYVPGTTGAVFVPKRSPSVGLRLRRQDSETPGSVDVGVQVGAGLGPHDLYIQEDDLSTPELLEPPALPTPAKIDWEIPRKALHSSIGFLVLPLYFSRPEIAPIINVLALGLAFVSAADVLRLNCRPFARLYEKVLGAFMRESEKASPVSSSCWTSSLTFSRVLIQTQINGVIWYLVGVIFVLKFYPRDVAVVSILILSWCDTAASTVGRAWGRYTPKLPRSILFIPIAPRKSLAGALGAVVTGSLITFSFWGWAVTPEFIVGEPPVWSWDRTSSTGGWFGLGALSLASGLVAGITEALGKFFDLFPNYIGGLDDNLTLPVISGALIWGVSRLIAAL
ncbi:hypothetical protein FRC09_012327 [Ceratobasidium sp. 395]|nr:hypothetical protein FRC09_012327 [Ceratobasidium sp. 395]